MTYSSDVAKIQNDINGAMLRINIEYVKFSPILRSSSLPYCGLRTLYEYTNFINQGNKHKHWFLNEVDTSGLAYMGIGTLLHKLFQDILPKELENTSLIGNWDASECTKSSCPHIGNRISQMNNKGCFQCQKFLPYRELSAYSSFSSHVDLLLKINNTKRVYILDIKTTSTRKMWQHRKTGKEFVQKNYQHQLNSYAVNFAPIIKDLGYELAGTIVWYVPRDTPNQHMLVAVEQKYTNKKLRKLAKHLDKCAKAYQLVSSIIGLTKKSKLQKISKKQIKKLQKTKLCQDSKYYKELVHEHYSICPLAETCFSTNCKKVQKSVDLMQGTKQ